MFDQVTIDAAAGTIARPNGADLDPDVLYELLRGARVGRFGG